MTDCDKARETINPLELPMRNFASALASHLNHYFASITAPTLRSTFSTQSMENRPSTWPPYRAVCWRSAKNLLTVGGLLPISKFVNQKGYLRFYQQSYKIISNRTKRD